MKVFRVLLATLKEIFEESAYERFCEREAWAKSRIVCDVLAGIR